MERISNEDERCQLLREIPGFGPLVSTATVAVSELRNKVIVAIANKPHRLGGAVQRPALSTSAATVGGSLMAVERCCAWKAQNAFHFSTATTMGL